MKKQMCKTDKEKKMLNFYKQKFIFNSENILFL